MDKKGIKWSVSCGILLLFAVVLTAFVAPKKVLKEQMKTAQFQENQIESVEINNGIPQPIDVTGKDSELGLITVEPDTQKKVPLKLIESLGEKYLVIKKPEKFDGDVLYEDLYMTRSIKLTFPNTIYELTSNDIVRVNGTKNYFGEPIFTEMIVPAEKEGSDPTVLKDYGNDLLHSVTVLSLPSSAQFARMDMELTLELDNVYVHSIYYDDEYYYIGLNRPKDVYDKIVVIDAGHGGKDAGAVSRDSQFYEKNLNTKVINYLKDMLDQEVIKVYYTRLVDEQVYLRPRVSLANAVDSDFFVSIHHNASTVQSPNGSEIYYYDKVAKGIYNKDLAQIFMDELSDMITLKNRGIQKKEEGDIFILGQAQIPTILIEIGYITNDYDLDYITKDENQMKAARGIYNGIMRAYEELLKEENK